MDDTPAIQGPPQAQFHWRDAHGNDWALTLAGDRLMLSGREHEEVITRANWDKCIDYNDVGGGVVFRFDIAERQVGFLVGLDQAEKFLQALGWSNRRAVESAARLQSLNTRPQTWPTVTAWQIAGLFSAAAAFIPLAGFGFGLLAIVCVAISLKQARSNERLVHAPAIALATVGILLVTTTANVLGLITFFTRSGEALGAPLADPAGDEISVASKVLAVLVVLISLSVHEAAHALTAWWCGDDGPRQRGRITLNPIAHIDPIGTILLPVILAAAGGAVFGWAKPVMVSLHGVPNPRRANILISAAGPLSNLLLGLIFLALLLILGCLLKLVVPQAQVVNFSFPWADVKMYGFAAANTLAIVAIFLKWGFLINVFLCVFNLIPIPPLDGGHVLGSLFPRSVGELYRKLGRFTFIIFLGMIFTGIVGYLLMPAYFLIALGFSLVSAATTL